MAKVFNINEYSKLKKIVKNHFQDQKTGEQNLYQESSKLFKPLIESSKESTNQLLSNQQNLSDSLLPVANRLEKRIEQVEDLKSLPYYNIPEIKFVPQSTPQKSDDPGNPDDVLNETDRENLQDLSLPLPSDVKEQNNYEEVLENIKTENRKIGQYLGKGSKKLDNEKQIHKSRKTTLIKYKAAIKVLKDNKPYIQTSGKGIKKNNLVKQKRSRGRPKTKADVILYNNADDLCQKLEEYIQAYEAGNNGVHNYIVEILDELLKIKEIDKTVYNKIFKNIFEDNIK